MCEFVCEGEREGAGVSVCAWSEVCADQARLMRSLIFSTQLAGVQGGDAVTGMDDVGGEKSGGGRRGRGGGRVGRQGQSTQMTGGQ